MNKQEKLQQQKDILMDMLNSTQDFLNTQKITELEIERDSYKAGCIMMFGLLLFNLFLWVFITILFLIL